MSKSIWNNIPDVERRMFKKGWDIKARRNWKSDLSDIEIPKGYKSKTLETKIGDKKVYSLFVKKK